MTKLQWSKLLVLILVPFLGVVYAYQFTNQARELITPFKPVKMSLGPVQLPHVSEAESESSEGEGPETRSELTVLDLKAPVTLVNFWATWCPPCVEEFPAMLELQRRLEDEGLEILFVSIDERWEDVEAFFQTHGLEVPPERLYWDPDRELASRWGAEKFPESFVLRRDAWAVEKIIGLQQWTRPAVINYFGDLAIKFEGIHNGLDAGEGKQ